MHCCGEFVLLQSPPSFFISVYGLFSEKERENSLPNFLSNILLSVFELFSGNQAENALPIRRFASVADKSFCSNATSIPLLRLLLLLKVKVGRRFISFAKVI
ncbi:hypothetical protein [Rufibacter roseus]|uniref:Uncharacterized protein n=1 Tax=Rufibacter roseus TaxID=1567108 RepID=A0ABW2DQK0_9BACT|nr:hypothetical protein [Rufibacter roseus]